MSIFNVLLNGKIIIKFVPTIANRKLTKSIIQFAFDTDQNQTQIKFCSISSTPGSGALMYEVSLFKNDWNKNDEFIIPSQNDQITVKNIYLNSTGNYSLKFVSKILFCNEPDKLFNVSIFWNDKEITKIYPNLQKIKLHSFTVSAVTGINNLTFYSSNYSKQANYNILISHLKLIQDTCNLIKDSQNLIENGDFSILHCGSGGSYLNLLNHFQNHYCLPGWIAINQTQIGIGTSYNPAIPNNFHIFELMVENNTCIKQTIILSPGRYVLQFGYAAKNTITNYNTFSVYFTKGTQKQQQFSYTPFDANYQNGKIQFDINSKQWNFELKFCGTGVGYREGTVITDIKLYKLVCK